MSSTKEVAPTADIVYTGFWVDYNQKPLGKYCLTLKTSSALMLLAALTVFVILSAGRSWRIWSSIAHCALERRQRKRYTALHTQRQHQVILRNSETAGGGFLALFGLIFKEFRSRRTRTVSLSHWILVALSLFHWAVFISLGILTSQIATGRTVRSIQTNHCGDWSPKPLSSLNASQIEQQEASATANELLLNSTLESEDYVRRCYDSASEGASGCERLVKRQLPHAIEDTECIFSKEICSAINGVAVSLDTGNVPFSDLGLNFRLADRLFFRRRSICSPLPPEPFLYGQEQALKALRAAGGSAIDNPKEIRAFSHVADETSKNRTTFFRESRSETYNLQAELALNGSLTSVLIRPQSPSMQVSIITLLGESMAYHSPFFDPLFNFNQRITSTDSTGNKKIFYRMGARINSVACQETVSYCSTYTDFCTPWGGMFEVENMYNLLAGDQINATDVQSALAAVQRAVMQSTIYSSISGRGASALQASRFVSGSNQLRLTQGQWRVELEHWFLVALTKMQLAMPRFVKTPGLDMNRVENTLDQAPLKDICSLVKFNSNEHITLSTLGIALVVAFSVTLTIISFWDTLLTPLIPQRVLTAWNRDHALELLVAPSETVSTLPAIVFMIII